MSTAKTTTPKTSVEHASVKDLIAQIEGVQPGGENYDAKVKVLSKYVRYHVKEEQNEMFPKVKKASLDLVELGAQMAARNVSMNLRHPGLGADGTSVSILRDHCQELGYEAFDWGQGFNTGPRGKLDAWLEDLADRISEQLSKHAKPATLIGWSLGGLYARELGKLLAPQLRQVITIATPFNGSADDNNAGWLSSVLSGGAASIDPTWIERLRIPPPIRTTSIYSRSDGVVAWETCRHDKRSRLVQDIEVDGSHMGMGWNPEVLNIVTDRLGQDEGPWRPYVGTT